MNVPKYIIVHTAAATGDYDISVVDRWHRTRGFNSVGYHYFIRRSGEVQKGREEHEIGAHCRDMGMNRQSIGICFEGHHNLEDWTSAQTIAFLRLVLDLMERYGIPHDNVLGHRETGARKDCPGTRIDMDWVRTMIRFSRRDQIEKLATLPAQDLPVVPPERTPDSIGSRRE